MKIRLGELRRIVREVAGGGEDLAAVVMLSAGGGVAVVYNPDVLLDSALRGALEPAEAIVGYVRLIDMSKYCAGAWELSEMWGPGRRGDMLMDIAFAMTPNGRLVPDRMDVSPAASKMLRRASERGDVTLEDLPPKCKSHHDEDHLKKIYSSSGDPSRLEALKTRHRAVMEELKKQGVDTEELEATLLDAGPAKFSGSIVRLGELHGSFETLG